MSVSVIIPALNEEACLEACLIGLTNQTIPPDEIIIIDGDSKDKTVEIASSYTNNIYTSKRKGVGLARAIGVHSSNNNIIVSTDADTVLEPHFIEYGLEDLNNVVAVTGTTRSTNKKGKKYEFFSNLSRKGRGYNTMFKKSSCDAAHCYTTIGVREDWNLWDELKTKGTVLYDPRLIAYTRLPTNLQKEVVDIGSFTLLPVVSYYTNTLLRRI